MTWNYRIIEHAEHLALHEVYYDGAGKVTSWTYEPTTFVADLDGAKDIVTSLNMALKDARERPVLIAADYPAIVRTEPSHRHAMTLRWSGEDDCWLAACPDLAPCSAHGNTPGKALANLQDAIAGMGEVMGAGGDKPG